jgi:hypothetical protein
LGAATEVGIDPCDLLVLLIEGADFRARSRSRSNRLSKEAGFEIVYDKS